MGAALNKVFLIGNLGAKPELKTIASGMTVATLSVATNETYQDKAGQKQERTEWHRVVVWGKTAEHCGKYLDKGKQVHIEGRLKTREWTDESGVKRWSTEIVAHSVIFLGGAPANGRREESPPPQEEGDVPF